MRACILFVCIFIGVSTSAQQTKIDSILPLLNTVKEDTSRALMLAYLSYYTLQTKPDSAFKIAIKGIQLSETIKYAKGQALNLNSIGSVYWFYSNYPKAIASYLESKRVAEIIHDTNIISTSFSNIGLIYSEQNDFRKALEYEMLAKEMFHTRANAYAKGGGDLNIAYYYSELNLLDSATFYAQLAYTNAKKLNDSLGIGLAFINLGEINSKDNHHTIGLEYLRAAVSFLPPSNEFARYQLFDAMANTYSEVGNSDSSLYYAKRAYSVSKRLGNVKAILASCKLLAMQFEKINILDSAFTYQKTATTLNDSLFNLERNKAIQNLELEESRRQAEVQAQLLKVKEERKQNIQYAAIAICIIILAAIFLAFSHSILAKPKTIRFVGIISLLLIFEFLNLLLHPSLSALTHHSPALMLLAMVSIAALLVPLHHRIEKWITHQLVEKNKRIRLAAAKKTIVALENS